MGIGLADIIQEGLVDFDDADVVVLEHIQGGVSRAEVVDGDADVVLAHDIDELLHGDGIVKVGNFGQFHFDVLAVKFVLVQDFENAVRKIFVAQMQLGKVRRNADGFDSCLHPIVNVVTGGLENVKVQFADGAFAFQNGNEVHGGHNGLVTDPAHQGFGAVYDFVCQANLGLVEHHQFAVPEGVVELAGDFSLVDRLDLHFLGEEHHVAVLDRSCGHHCRGGVVQGVAYDNVFFDGVDAHTGLNAGFYGFGALAQAQFRIPELFDKFFLAILFGQNEEVVATQSCNQFGFVQEQENLLYEGPKGEVAHLVAHRLINILEVLQVNKEGCIVPEVFSDELLGKGENACLVVGSGHAVGNGDLAGVAHETGAASENKEVPAQQLDELSFVFRKGVAFDRVGLEGERSLLAGGHGFGKIGGSR